MTSSHKKLANANHEESARYTTRTTSRHGVSPSMKACGRRRNRAAKRAEARWALKNEAA